MDLVLEAWVSGLIELAKLKHIFGRDDRWHPGRRLRLLFAGYNGARNTGSDVRVEEMLRQVRQVLGRDRVELSVLTQNFDLTRGYFGDAKQVKLPDIFPLFLAREVARYDGVVACEGSMFKSKFADALTVMMVGALGIAAARNRISVGYGAEAGAMNRVPRWMTRRYCRNSLVITRNEESRDLLADLGVSTELGTDTAWTMEPLPEEYGRRELANAGWDGETPVLAVCPINPFWWPVRASLLRALARPFGAFRSSHYRSIYFHRSGPGVEQAYEGYLSAIAGAVRGFASRSKVFPVFVAMEQLDAHACDDLSRRLDGAPVFRSSTYDMYQLVSIVRCAAMMVSSRYHGIVTSMPAGVASAGITMDERIRNLMKDRGQGDLLLEVDEPDLEEKLGAVLDRLARDREAIREGIGRTVVANLKSMASMGVRLEEHVRQHHPDFPARSGIHSWEEYLPPLSPGLRAVIERYS